MNILDRVRQFFADGWMVSEPVARMLFPHTQKQKLYHRIRLTAKVREPFADSIDEMMRRARERRNGVMFAALRNINERLGRGRTIGEALEGWVPPEERMLLTAGDRRGYDGFAAAIDDILYLGKVTGSMVSRIVMGVLPPLAIVLAQYLLMLWMAVSFTTKALNLTHVNPSQLTGRAREFYEVGLFAQSPWAWGAPVLVVIVLSGILVSMPYWTRPAGLRRKADLVPPYSLYKAIVGSRWLLAFAAMGKAGIPYESIFEETGRMASPWLKGILGDIERLYRRGVGLGPAFVATGQNFPSRSIVDDLVSFGDRPGFEDTLMVLARDRVEQTLAISSLIAAVMTAFGYAFAAFGSFWIMMSFNAMESQIQMIIQTTMR